MEIQQQALDHDSPVYRKMHHAVVKEYGYARNHNCIDCNGFAIDWTYTHGEDPLSVASYKPRCRSCHMKYDGSSQGEKHGSAVLTEADIIEIREMHLFGYTQRTMASMFGVSKTAIANIIHRKKWRHI